MGLEEKAIIVTKKDDNSTEIAVNPSRRGVIAGAVAGGAFGTMVPVVGTLAGTVVGGIAGFIFGPSD